MESLSDGGRKSFTQQLVNDFYNADPPKEWGRRDEPRSRVEMATTLHLIGRYVPSRGHVGDIAAGPGRYTLKLLARGFRVTLVDGADALPRLAPCVFATPDQAVRELGHSGFEVGSGTPCPRIQARGIDRSCPHIDWIKSTAPIRIRPT